MYMIHAHTGTVCISYADLRVVGENVDSESRPNHFLQVTSSHSIVLHVCTHSSPGDEAGERGGVGTRLELTTANIPVYRYQ